MILSNIGKKLFKKCLQHPNRDFYSGKREKCKTEKCFLCDKIIPVPRSDDISALPCALMLFPWCPFTAIRARREFRSVFYVLYTYAESQARGEESAPRWRRHPTNGVKTRDVPAISTYAAGDHPHATCVTFFSLPLPPLLSPLPAYTFPLRFPPSSSPTEREFPRLHPVSRPTGPLLRPADQSPTGFMSRLDLTNGHYTLPVLLCHICKKLLRDRGGGGRKFRKMFRIISCKMRLQAVYVTISLCPFLERIKGIKSQSNRIHDHF